MPVQGKAQVTTVIDLFAGCGGLSLGGKRAGLTSVAAYEHSASACDAYARVVGDPIEQADLADIDLRRIPDAEGIIGGPPCQAFSIANNSLRTGATSKKNLWPATLRIVAAKRPRWFLFENVPNLAENKQNAVYFQSLLMDFRALGYRVDWRILDAADYGVPQHRRRLFIAGRLGGQAWRWPETTHARENGLWSSRWNSWDGAIRDIVPTLEPDTLPKWITDKYTRRGAQPPQYGYFTGEHLRVTMNHRDAGLPAPTVTCGIHHARRVNWAGSTYRADARVLATLQTLPRDVGLTFEQIGNAVPPLLAQAVLGMVQS